MIIFKVRGGLLLALNGLAMNTGLGIGLSALIRSLPKKVIDAKKSSTHNHNGGTLPSLTPQTQITIFQSQLTNLKTLPNPFQTPPLKKNFKNHHIKNL